ncbi:MAG: hypothetical protein LBV51_02030, partial [Acholeplasmatales bacterium]|nr:hypothetical protein [Acholeplasmatales bacterium]
MVYYIYQMLMTLLVGLFYILKYISDFFTLFSGLDSTNTFGGGKTVTSNDGTLISWLLNQNVITTVFMVMIGIAFLVLIIITLIAVIRSFLHIKEKNGEVKPFTKILFNGAKSVLLTLFTGAVVIMGVLFSNFLLKQINNGFNISTANTEMSFGDILVNEIFGTGFTDGNDRAVIYYTEQTTIEVTETEQPDKSIKYTYTFKPTPVPKPVFSGKTQSIDGVDHKIIEYYGYTYYLIDETLDSKGCYKTKITNKSDDLTNILIDNNNLNN